MPTASDRRTRWPTACTLIASRAGLVVRAVGTSERNHRGEVRRRVCVGRPEPRPAATCGRDHAAGFMANEDGEPMILRYSTR
jgi:hypothetical protein